MKSNLHQTLILFFLLILICNGCSIHSNEENSHKPNSFIPTLVIHGGAGTITKENLSPEIEKEYRHKLEEALNAGYEVLNNNGTSIDAIIAAIIVLEDSPLFNAGKGAVFTHDGKNELDASIMDGNTGEAGAVSGVQTIKNPISAAHCVMTLSEHVLLTGIGAQDFAKKNGLTLVEPDYFFTERRHNQLLERQQKEKLSNLYCKPFQDRFDNYKFGTVGAVALDKHGNLAAGTSTGGMTNKRFGRVGDSPIIGAGTFADNNTCAVSATGHGEYFIRNVVAYDIAARMKYQNISLHQAANEIIVELKHKGGSGGVISIDKHGNIAMPFNTSGMYRGYIQQINEAHVMIYKD